MKLLVTGGLGVVGSRFVQRAQAEGHHVTVIDACEHPRNEWLLKRIRPDAFVRSRVEHYAFDDICSYGAILHAAAHTGIPHSAEDPNDDWRSNVDGTRALLEAMRQQKCAAPCVLLSSVKPYRVHDLPYEQVADHYELRGPFRGGIEEGCLLEPDEPYAASKLAQSALGMAYARTYGLPVTVLRCSNLYGDAPCHGPRHGWLTWFCIAAVLGLRIEQQGFGFQTRDMLFSNDVTSAVVRAIDKIDLTQGNVYNIGGGIDNAISCRDAIAFIEETLRTRLDITHNALRPNDDPIFVTDHSKFTKATGWQPEIKVRDGIRRILVWAYEYRDELRALYHQ